MAKGFADLALMEACLSAAEGERYASLLAAIDSPEQLSHRGAPTSRSSSALRDEFVSWVEPIARRLGITPTEKLWHLAFRRQFGRSREIVVYREIVCGSLFDDFRENARWTVFHHLLLRWRQEDLGAWSQRTGYWDAVQWTWEQAARLRVHELCAPVLDASGLLSRFMERADLHRSVLPRAISRDANCLSYSDREFAEWVTALPQHVQGVATADWASGDRWFDSFVLEGNHCRRSTQARLLARTAQICGVDADQYLRDFETRFAELWGDEESSESTVIAALAKRISKNPKADQFVTIGQLESFLLDDLHSSAAWEDEFCSRSDGTILKDWFLDICLREDAYEEVEAEIAEAFLHTFEHGVGSLLRLCDTASRYCGTLST